MKNSVVKTRDVDVTPDISLMKKMSSISGNNPSRIMELVDNAIDAKIPGKPLEVKVNVVRKRGKQYIEVIDNGTGMTELVARSFFRLGDSQKFGKKKIGRFGLGSKIAILGIGDTCKVTTTPFGEPYAIDIHFDIHEFKEWKIDYKMKPAKREDHGTKIRIENITTRIGNIERFCERLHEHFAKAYKHFIEKHDVSIKINGKKVRNTKVDLIPDLYQEFDFLVNGKRVYGWAGAMKEAGQNWKFGFDLISNGRIIKPNDLLNRQAHTSLARLVGEIHLDDFKTDIHKMEFLRDDEDFQAMQEQLLGHVLKELIAKIAKLTNREVFDKYREGMVSVSKMLNSAIRSQEFLENIEIDSGIFKKMKENARKNEKRKNVKKEPKEEELEEILVEDELEEEFEMEVNEEKPKRRRRDTGLVINEPVGVSAGEDQPNKRWVAVETENGVALNVEVNLDHPTYQTDEDVSILIYMKNAVLDSVAEFILQEEKKHLGFVEDEIERLNQLKDVLFRCSLKK